MESHGGRTKNRPDSSIRQQDTVQVYNLVAEDTVEERIYVLLEEKLREIAAAIGKVDAHGDVVEDFRSEILGFLGSSPNYQELYKRALVDRDYKRTEEEIAQAIERAKEASEALRSLTQDLETFDLEHYRQLRGQFSLEDLKLFVEKAMIHLGGTFIPTGHEVFRVDTPQVLREYPSVAAKYEAATFNRDLAMRRRKVEFMGLGHPLIDAVLTHLRSPGLSGGVGDLLHNGNGSVVSVRWLVSVQTDRGTVKEYYKSVLIDKFGSTKDADERRDIVAIKDCGAVPGRGLQDSNAKALGAAKASLEYFLAELRAATEGIAAIRPELVGLAVSDQT